MLLRAPFQAVINITVITLVIAAMVLGVLMLVPAKNPAGSLVGKVLSSKGNLSSLLASLDPQDLADALNENPEMASMIVKELGDQDAKMIAEAVNNNPQFISQLIAGLNPHGDSRGSRRLSAIRHRPHSVP